MITFPLLRYAITTAYADADTYMFVGRIENEPWIEVGAEDVDGETWIVFHAMLLTSRGAQDVLALSGGLIDLRGEVVPQRLFIGPQYGRKC